MGILKQWTFVAVFFVFITTYLANKVWASFKCRPCTFHTEAESELFLFQVADKLVKASTREKADGGVAEQGLELQLTTRKHENKAVVFEEPMNGSEGTILDRSEAKDDRKLDPMFLGEIVVEQPNPSETSHEEYALSTFGDHKKVPEEARDTMAVKDSSFTISANNIKESKLSKEEDPMTVSVTRSEVTDKKEGN